ncbi:MAG: metal ABC transporter substrate-binding protein [Chloroflexota bacterium]
MIKPFVRILVVVLAVALLVVGGSPIGLAQPRKLSVVTSSTVFVDMIQRVGGDQVDAFSLVPAGADVHTFQPTPRDVQRASTARLAVWNGFGLDEIAENTVANLNVADLLTVTMADGLDAIMDAEHGPDHEMDADGHEHADGNPHFWLDPRNAVRYVEQIRDALSAADPVNATSYAGNAGRYIAEINEVDAWAEGQISQIPPARRKLVTFHDAFPYLARRYGLDVVGVVLKSPGREPSAQEVAEVVTQIKSQSIPAVYVEPQFNSRILDLAARDAGVSVRVLYSDALDDRVKSYLELMRFNVKSLVEGLK